MSDEQDIHARTRNAGQIWFVAGALVLTLVLLSQIRGQTLWVDGKISFAAQPRFWPAVGLISMAVGLGLHLWRMKRRWPGLADKVELRRWLEPVEYVIWFMVFVFMVPVIGFLPMSVGFACALTWRLGYRGKFYLIAAAAFAIGTVLFFKAGLGVRIPGAWAYGFLPNPLQSFFIVYL